MKCYGDDEFYHRSFLLWGFANMIFTTSPLTNRTRLFSKPAAFYFYGKQGESCDRRSWFRLLMLAM